MRILHTSDWHIGRSLNGYSLLEDQRYFLHWLSRLMREKQVEALFVSGDIYNSSVPSAEAVCLLDEFLTDTILNLHIPVMIIAGNHDSAKRLKFSSRLLERQGLYISGDFSNGVEKIPLQNEEVCVHVFLLPYIEPAAVKEMFPKQTVTSFDDAVSLVQKHLIGDRLPEGMNLLLAHGFYLNFSQHQPNLCDSELHVGGSDSVNLARFSDFDYIALGHLHGPQKAGDNGYYSGSPLKYSISEARQKKQVTLLDLHAPRVVEQTSVFVEPLRDLKVLRGKLQELLLQSSDDYVCVELTDRAYQLGVRDQLQRAFPHLLELHYINLKEKNPEVSFVRQKKQPRQVFAEFFTQVTGQEMQPEEEKLLKEILKEVENETN